MQLVIALQQQGINLEDASLHPQVAALLKQAAASAGSSSTSSMSTSPARATPLGETGNGNGFVAVELPSVSQTGDDEPDRAVVVLDVPQDDEPMEIGKEEKADDSKEQRAIATRTFKTGSWVYVCLHVCVCACVCCSCFPILKLLFVCVCLLFMFPHLKVAFCVRVFVVHVSPS